MKGQLPKFSVEAVLQVLGTGRSSGAFVVDHADGGTFVAYLENGQLVHAEFGETQGMEALTKLIRNQKGEFHFRSGYATGERSIRGMLEMVLMGAVMDASKPVRRPVPANVPLGQVKFKIKGALGSMMDDAGGGGTAVAAPQAAVPLEIAPVLLDLQRDPKCTLTTRVGLKLLRSWEKKANRGIHQVEVRATMAKPGMTLGVSPAPDLEDAIAIEPNLAASLELPELAMVWVKPL